MKLNSVRGKESLRALGTVAAAALLLLLVAALFVFFYLQRYVVYSPEGAAMATPGANAPPEGMAAAEPYSTVSPVIIYDDPLPEESAPATPAADLPALNQLSAVYVPYNDLLDIPALEAKLKGMDYASLVIQVKRDHGSMAWPTAIAGADDYTEGDTQAAAAFFQKQVQDGKYLVAQIACFRDDLFALDNQSEGLPIRGGALWVDSGNYYWLSPASPPALDYIVQIGKELQLLGFSELLLDKFCFPTTGNTSSIVYSSDKTKSEIITDSANQVAGALSAAGLRVSILCEASACKTGVDTSAGLDLSVLTGVFDRVYVALDTGGEVSAVTDGLIMASGGKVFMKNWLVFITASNDTRFAEYGVAKVYEP